MNGPLIHYDGTTFRERFREYIAELDRELRGRFGMSLDEFSRKITPKPNPAAGDPVFDWRTGRTRK